MENTTSTTAIYRNNIRNFNFLFGSAMFCLCVAVINIVCMFILFKSKKLQKSRFHFLTLCLSIGDFLTMIFTFVLLTNAAMEVMLLHIDYLCFLTSSVVYCSILFSLCQTLLICVERSLATSTTNKMRRGILAQKKFIPLVFVFCVMYTIFLFGITGFSFQSGCLGNDYTYTYMVFKEVPLISLLVVITIIYIKTAIKIKQLVTKVSFINNEISLLLSSRRLKRYKLNLVTLLLILLVLTISIVPRVLVALIGQSQSGNLGNFTLVLPPIFNPIIYVLRFVEVRTMLKQKCVCCFRNDESLQNSTSPFQISSNLPINEGNSTDKKKKTDRTFQTDSPFNEGNITDKEKVTDRTFQTDSPLNEGNSTDEEKETDRTFQTDQPLNERNSTDEEKDTDRTFQTDPALNDGKSTDEEKETDRTFQTYSPLNERNIIDEEKDTNRTYQTYPALNDGKNTDEEEETDRTFQTDSPLNEGNSTHKEKETDRTFQTDPALNDGKNTDEEEETDRTFQTDSPLNEGNSTHKEKETDRTYQIDPPLNEGNSTDQENDTDRTVQTDPATN